MDINIVTVKWGVKYPAYYVNKIYKMVKRNLDLPYKFICLTDDSHGLNPAIEALPFTRSNLEHWWTKLTIFELNHYKITGTGLFLDLDLLITDKINCLFDHKPENDFMSILDWSRLDQINSSLMRFNIEKSNFIIENFYEMLRNKSIQKTVEWDAYMKFHKIVYKEKNSDLFYEGDQKWISRQLILQNVTDCYYPSDWILSYKRHGHKNLPVNCKVMVFHGDPKPSQVDLPYVQQLWEQ